MYTKEDSPGYRISLLSRLFGPAVNTYYEAFGVTFGQMPFILEVLEQPGLTQEQLSEFVVVDKAAAARTLAALEAQGLLLRKENPENRRQKLVYPTEKLKRIKLEIKNIVTELNDQFLGGFDASEKEKVLQVLDQLIANCRKIKNEKKI